MKRVWIIVAVALALTGFVFVLRSSYDKAFIAAALGAVAWFLSYRVQMREVVGPDEPEELLNEDLESDEKE